VDVVFLCIFLIFPHLKTTGCMPSVVDTFSEGQRHSSTVVYSEKCQSARSRERSAGLSVCKTDKGGVGANSQGTTLTPWPAPQHPRSMLSSHSGTKSSRTFPLEARPSLATFKGVPPHTPTPSLHNRYRGFRDPAVVVRAASAPTFRMPPRFRRSA